jgi:signal transduction histidine kinase
MADVCLGAGLALALTEWTPASLAVPALLLALAATAYVAVWRPRHAGEGTRREASEVRQLKQEFLSTVSHELRTPLNAILGWTELLRTQQPGTPGEQERGLRIIARNARREQRLIEELLDAAVTPDSPLERAPLDVRELVESVVDDQQSAAHEGGVRLDSDLGPPAAFGDVLHVSGDALRLRVALSHMIENALRFTPGGGLVHVRLVGTPRAVTIEIRDNGIGIDPAFQPHMFDAFRQQDSSPSRAYGGLGLGLAIAQATVEAHGGSIRVRSPGTGQGSTFFVTLPRWRESADSTESARRLPISRGRAH